MSKRRVRFITDHLSATEEAEVLSYVDEYLTSLTQGKRPERGKAGRQHVWVYDDTVVAPGRLAFFVIDLNRRLSGPLLYPPRLFVEDVNQNIPSPPPRPDEPGGR